MAKDDFPFSHDEFRLQARRLPRRTVRSDAPNGRQRHPNGCRLPAHGSGDLCWFIWFGGLTDESSSWKKSDVVEDNQSRRIEYFLPRGRKAGPSKVTSAARLPRLLASVPEPHPCARRPLPHRRARLSRLR